MPVTSIAVRALARLGGPRVILAAVPGGIRAVADRAGVSPGRVSQVLRKNPFPLHWARLIAGMVGCNEWEIYEQLGQHPPVSPYGPLFDQQLSTTAPAGAQ